MTCALWILFMVWLCYEAVLALEWRQTFLWLTDATKYYGIIGWGPCHRLMMHVDGRQVIQLDRVANAACKVPDIWRAFPGLHQRLPRLFFLTNELCKWSLSLWITFMSPSSLFLTPLFLRLFLFLQSQFSFIPSCINVSLFLHKLVFISVSSLHHAPPCLNKDGIWIIVFFHSTPIPWFMPVTERACQHRGSAEYQISQFGTQ